MITVGPQGNLLFTRLFMLNFVPPASVGAAGVTAAVSAANLKASPIPLGIVNKQGGTVGGSGCSTTQAAGAWTGFCDPAAGAPVVTRGRGWGAAGMCSCCGRLRRPACAVPPCVRVSGMPPCSRYASIPRTHRAAAPTAPTHPLRRSTLTMCPGCSGATWCGCWTGPAPIGETRPLQVSPVAGREACTPPPLEPHTAGTR